MCHSSYHTIHIVIYLPKSLIFIHLQQNVWFYCRKSICANNLGQAGRARLVVTPYGARTYVNLRYFIKKPAPPLDRVGRAAPRKGCIIRQDQELSSRPCERVGRSMPAGFSQIPTRYCYPVHGIPYHAGRIPEQHYTLPMRTP